MNPKNGFPHCTRRVSTAILAPAAWLAALVGTLLSPTPVPAETLPEPAVTVYLVLEGEPASAVFLRLRDTESSPGVAAAVRAQEAEIRLQQEDVASRLSALGAREVGRVIRLVNALRVRAPQSQLASLAALPGVTRVVPALRHELLLSTSVPFIGAPSVWQTASTNLDGAGMRIGIIDTGIDYTHADFGGPGVAAAYNTNNPTVIEPGTFPTAKVIGGYDFVGNSYNASDSTNAVPVPDPDPLDCNTSGHGTHVAGIAAGFGVLSTGATFAGSYSSLSNFTQFTIGPGVAPRAKLYALKVFGCTGSTDVVLDALDWAVDPDKNGDYSDRLDVLNLSLGSPFGLAGAGDPEQDAINRLSDLGTVVVVAAGNSGNTFYVHSTPASAQKALSVANTMDSGLNGPAINVLQPAAVAGSYLATEGAVTRQLSVTGPIVGQVVLMGPPDACSAPTNSAALAGRIAMFDRGTCNFTDKIKRAQDAGAIAVLCVNNVPGDPIVMGGTATYTVTIPGVMISQADGGLLKAHLGENLTVRLATDQAVSRADQLNETSSRGPSAPGSVLKPEIAAPGTSIISARSGGGTGAATLTGTSMASPHVAGAAALLRQQHPDWSAEEIKAALMNTARPTRNGSGLAYPESRTGAGRLHVSDAARVTVTARAAGDGGGVALSFGSLELTNTLVVTRDVLLRNRSGEPVDYEVAVSNTVPRNGCALVALASHVTVPAGGEIAVPVQLTANPALFDRTGDPTTPTALSGVPRQILTEFSGQVWFLHTNLPIHVPYHACVRAASDCRTQAVLVAPAVPNQATVLVPVGGAPAHPQALVSVFQLGALSPALGATNPALNVADLLAVGAASDAATKPNLSEATIYFGLAVAGAWATPYPDMAEFDVQMDTNHDGQADFTLRNGYGVLPAYPDANDIFMSVLRNAAGSETTNRYLNAFDASVRDTAPFNNHVLVLPVAVKSLGLSAANPVIRYRVTTLGAGQVDNPPVDSTDWVSFDASQPVLDATPQGLAGTPFFTDGVPIPVSLHRSAATNHGLSAGGSAGLLLLHHFNLPGRSFDILRVSLNPLPQLLPPTFDSAGHAQLHWLSFADSTYAVEASTDLAAGFDQVLATGLAATPPTNHFTDPNAVAGARFYRLRQE